MEPDHETTTSGRGRLESSPSKLTSEAAPMGRDPSDRRPFDTVSPSKDSRQAEYHRLREEWENQYASRRPPFVEAGAPPRVSFFAPETFPDVYPKFGSALARDPNVQDQYRSMLAGRSSADPFVEKSSGSGGGIASLHDQAQVPLVPGAGRGLSPINRGGRWDATRSRQSDAVAQRESQIMRLHRASNDSMQLELDKLKEQSKQQRAGIKVQMDNLKREALNVQSQHQKALYEDFMGIHTALNPAVKDARALTTYELGLSGWNGPTMGEALNHELARPLDAQSVFVPQKASVLDSLYGPAERKQLLDDFLAQERQKLVSDVLYPQKAKTLPPVEEAILRRDDWTKLAVDEEGRWDKIKPPSSPVTKITYAEGEIGYVPPAMSAEELQADLDAAEAERKAMARAESPLSPTGDKREERILRSDNWLNSMPGGRPSEPLPQTGVLRIDWTPRDEEEASGDDLNKRIVGEDYDNGREGSNMSAKSAGDAQGEQEEVDVNVELVYNPTRPKHARRGYDYTLIFKRSEDGRGGQLCVTREYLRQLAAKADTLYIDDTNSDPTSALNQEEEDEEEDAENPEAADETAGTASASAKNKDESSRRDPEQHQEEQDPQFVQLKLGVRWPLNRLADGLPFSIGPGPSFAQNAYTITDERAGTLEGDTPVEGRFAVSGEIAEMTWEGTAVANMVYPFAQSPEVYYGPDVGDTSPYLYHACYNAEGLQLLIGLGDGSCGWQKGTPDDIRVFLGIRKETPETVANVVTTPTITFTEHEQDRAGAENSPVLEEDRGKDSLQEEDQRQPRNDKGGVEEEANPKEQQGDISGEQQHQTAAPEGEVAQASPPDEKQPVLEAGEEVKPTQYTRALIESDDHQAPAASGEGDPVASSPTLKIEPPTEGD
ncbi:unnamed protein product [Amoebophrya sp. A25]|nr:unnamed protein product [Amoebophrya sp. A25]|eukprot:GSA25T00013323001.1